MPIVEGEGHIRDCIVECASSKLVNQIHGMRNA
jgi:hypothetical protein